MKLRLTTLTDDIAGRGDILAEGGLSILIEADEIKILLDTGKTITAVHNAYSLGIDIGDIDKIVLSHSHYDHTGGLREVLSKVRKKEIEIIAHPHIWSRKYVHRRDELAKKFMGMPFQREELENYGAVFRLTSKPVKITDSIITSGEVPVVTDFEDFEEGDTSYFIKEGTDFQHDSLLDDQAIVVKTDIGLLVVAGCAHRGIINTLYHAQQITGVKTIHAVVGGAHLLAASEERISLTFAALKKLNIQKIGLCHCTGLGVMALMVHEFGDKFFFNTAGSSIDLP